jgi:hypothetical protein
MIVFELACPGAHRFEGWFASSQAYAEQHAAGLVRCPECGSDRIAKAPMAPAVPAKGNARVAGETTATHKVPPAIAKALRALAEAQARALEGSTWVGDAFAEKSRAMHYGEEDHATIHGRATPGEAVTLLEEGVAIAPLLVPVIPPDELN